MKKMAANCFLLLLILTLATAAFFWRGPVTCLARAGRSLEKNMAKYRYHKNFEQLEFTLLREAKLSPLAIRLCLYDFATEKWFGLEEDRPVYPASLIKTLYLLAALEQVEQGHLSLQQDYMLTEEHRYAGGTPVTGSGLLQFAPGGQNYRLEELLSLMVSASDNIAANMVLDLVGPARITNLARRLGLEQTRATRKMYDLTSSLPSNRSTARELTKMLVALQKRQVCHEELTLKAIKMMEQTNDKDRIGLKLTGSPVIVANKTGTVTGMIGDMALLYYPDRPPVAVTIIIENPPSKEEAAREIGRLSSIIVNLLKP